MGRRVYFSATPAMSDRFSRVASTLEKADRTRGPGTEIDPGSAGDGGWRGGVLLGVWLGVTGVMLNLFQHPRIRISLVEKEHEKMAL